MTGEHMEPIAHDMENDEIDLRELFLNIWDGRWLIVAITAVMIVLGGGYAKLNPSFNGNFSFRPLATFEEDEYKELNAIEKSPGLSFFKVDKEILIKQFSERLIERTVLNDAIKNQNYFDPSDFATPELYEAAVSKLASEIEIIPPTDDEKLAKARGVEKERGTGNWVVRFKGSDKEKFLRVMNEAFSHANESIRQELQRRFKLEVEIAERKKQYDIEDLNRYIANAKNDYERRTSDRLAFLTEQSAIARKLNIAKNTIETQNFSGANSVLTTVKTENPYYLHGYEAIEKEIDLLKNRPNKEAFMTELLDLEIKIRTLQQDPTIKRAVTAIASTPITTGEHFKAALFDVGTIDIQNQRKLSVFLAGAGVLGLFLGVVVVLIRKFVMSSFSE